MHGKKKFHSRSFQPIGNELHRVAESIDPHHILYSKTSLTGESTQGSVALFTD
jgi:hypothetical protein